MAKFGDYENVAKEYNVGGGDRLEFKKGDNPIRIVTEFQEHPSHFVEGKGQFACLGKKCALCAKGHKMGLKFVGWVIDRTEEKDEDKFKLVYLPYSVYKDIGVYALSKDYAFDSVPPYDITVKKTGEDKQTRYKVVPDRKDTPLTEMEMQQVATLRPPKEIVEALRAKYPGMELGESEQPDPNADIPIINTDEVEKDYDEKEVKEEDLPF